MAEWSKATDCKSVGESLRWFKSNSYHHFYARNALTALLAAALAQQVEHIHGKDGVSGPSPEGGSRKSQASQAFAGGAFYFLATIWLSLGFHIISKTEMIISGIAMKMFLCSAL